MNESNFNSVSYEDIEHLENCDMLDCPFTVDEIAKTISSLKRHKSSDFENNVADFFIESNYFIAPYLVTIFNCIYDSHTYPESWSKGVIVPIYKKGDRFNPSNYRGITLINVIAKIFSLALRNRINKWCEQSKKFADEQFGFRDNHSTTDCIFILHSIIQNVLANNKKMYCAFIDYEKAFDTVIHDALWVKLVQSGMSCKILKMIKAIYLNVKSCVKDAANMCFSEFFDVSLGLKQGEPLSPLLFILFINDIKDCIDVNNLTEGDLNYLSVYMLLFADDIALFSTDKVSLQRQLDSIAEYSNKWGLKINVNKTKICIFEKRKTVSDFQWYIYNNKIEIVDTFCYLGVVFKHTGNLKDAAKTLHEQALKAYNNLLSVFNRVKIDLKTKLSMFDTLVVPILLYGSEIWGVYNYKEIDKLHLRFCKYILGVRPQTSNVAVFGELGRKPLSVIAKERALKYWLKIMHNNDSLINKTFLKQKSVLRQGSWASNIKSTFDRLGLGFIWQNFDANNRNYSALIKQRLHDQYVQSWSEELSNQPKMEYYRKYKIEFKFENYLYLVNNDKIRKEMSRFRLSSHSLEIEQGRFLGIGRENRYCKLCTQNVIESEFHFLLCCPAYSNIRRQYFENRSWPTIQKFINILSCTNPRKIRNTAKFIYNAMNIRKEKLKT
jgi:hypothetical protein